MDTFPDLGSLSDQELKDLIQQLTDEEVEVSCAPSSSTGCARSTRPVRTSSRAPTSSA